MMQSEKRHVAPSCQRPHQPEQSKPCRCEDVACFPLHAVKQLLGSVGGQRVGTKRSPFRPRRAAVLSVHVTRVHVLITSVRHCLLFTLQLHK